MRIDDVLTLDYAFSYSHLANSRHSPLDLALHYHLLSIENPSSQNHQLLENDHVQDLAF